MLINDPVYGRQKIDSKVLIELIKSVPVQRLKKIAQFAIPDKYYFVKNITRFEHSVGVMLLLRKLGASEKEQIAGLLHDVSHTAFSHLIDWVIGNAGGDESYQDERHKSFIKSNALAKILKKYSYKPQEIFEYKHFGLLEESFLCFVQTEWIIL
ncbi:MAG: HD domain-containing protein [Candidatus Levybacteria bacterium]|nr:HD domain-containing protein [Candidatus Levybacteria bacterium]